MREANGREAHVCAAKHLPRRRWRPIPHNGGAVDDALLSRCRLDSAGVSNPFDDKAVHERPRNKGKRRAEPVRRKVERENGDVQDSWNGGQKRGRVQHEEALEINRLVSICSLALSGQMPDHAVFCSSTLHLQLPRRLLFILPVFAVFLPGYQPPTV